MNLTQGNDRMLTPGQQRVLELDDGDSFLLQTIPVDENNSVLQRWRYRSALQVAARLTTWAREHHILIVYRLIDKETARIWRLGMI